MRTFQRFIGILVFCGAATVAAGQDSVSVNLLPPPDDPSTSTSTSGQIIGKPAGPPPTPEHTGIKAMAKELLVDFKHLPSKQNLFWVGMGGGLAVGAHTADTDVNKYFTTGGGSGSAAHNVFAFGAVLGESYTLLPVAAMVYTVGRWKDIPRVSHMGSDLLQSVLVAEVLTQGLKYTARRERPDGSGKNSFPSGHSADTMAFATALERHFGWKGAVPAYIFASYVAASRLHDNKHYLSDVVFGSAVGIIAGRTVTRPGHELPVAVVSVPGGAAIMYVRRGN